MNKIESNNKTVLFVIVPLWDTKMPPTGLAYIASSVEKEGFNVNIFDLNIELFDKINDSEKKLWDHEYFEEWNKFSIYKRIFKEHKYLILKLIDSIKKTNPLLVCFSVNAGNHNSTIEVMKIMKNHKVSNKICVGGPNIDQDYFMKTDMKKYADFAMIGEGEIILSKLLHKIRNKEVIIESQGLFFPKKKEKLNEINRAIVDNLNSIPNPTFKGFPLKKYTQKKLPILSSRGCIKKCSFCSDYLMSKKFRIRDPEKIIKEIKYHLKYNKIKRFQFQDLLINGDIKNLNKLCDLIIKSKLNIVLSGQGIIRKEMTIKLLKKMKQAGFESIIYGVESFSNNVLKMMNKGITTQIIHEVLLNTNKANIQVKINLIIGFPEETKNEFNETLAYIKKNHKLISCVSSLNPLTIYGFSKIQLNPNSFGIKVPIKKKYQEWLDKGGYIFWKDKNNLDFEERTKRIKKTCILLDKMNIPHPQSLFVNNKHLTKKKIELILINPPPWGIEDPPTGLAYIATYLKNKNIKVSCYDINIKFYNSASSELKHLWHVENKNFWKNKKTFNKLLNFFNQQINETVSEIIKQNPKIIAFNVVDPKERITIELIKRIKKVNSEIKVLLGGPGTNTKDSRSWFIDSIPELIEGYIIGEGEETLYETSKALLKNKSIDDVPGIITYKNNKYNEFKPRKLLSITKQDIWPRYEEFNLKEYHSNALRVEWSRGCIADCVFCKGKALNPGYRFRNPESIVNELEYHVNKHNLRKFVVVDLTVNGNLKKLEEVCNLIIKKKLNIEWLAQGIPRKEMNYNFFKKMKQAGCYELQFGLESGSDKVLKVMKKRHTVKEAEQCIIAASKAGIRIGLFILVGFPNESEKDFNMTLEFIKQNKNHISYIKSINAIHLIENTNLQENHEEFGIQKPEDKTKSKFPEYEWYYKWETKEGNNWSVRQKRMKKMYDLLKELKIPLTETNYEEGKETSLNKNIVNKINNLQDLIKFTNLGTKINKNKNPLKLFFECLKEHGLIYTAKHTIQYLNKNLIK